MDGIVSKKARNFSIPIPLLAKFQNDWQKYGKGKISLRLVPLTKEIDGVDNGIELSGEVSTLVSMQELRRAPHGRMKSKVEVTCRKENVKRDVHPFTLNVFFTMKLVAGEHVVVDISLEPRAMIENMMPLPIKIRTPMPQTFSTCQKEVSNEDKETTYFVNPDERVEVFTPGPSIAITTRMRDNPIAGHDLGWLDGGWVDLPLIKEFRLQDAISGTFPLEVENSAGTDRLATIQEPGAEFFIVEGKERLLTIADISAQNPKDVPSSTPHQLNPKGAKLDDSDPLLFILTVCNYGVDHTGNILFEQVSRNERTSSWRSESSSQLRESQRYGRNSSLLDRNSESLHSSGNQSFGTLRGPAPLPIGAFLSPIHKRRVSLLPNAQYAIRLLQMTIEGTDGFRRTMVC